MPQRLPSSIDWPDGKDFAFTIFDDTERGTVENNRAIYGLLAELGMRTTKSLWPSAGPGKADIPGPTCEEPEYLALCHELEAQGFELALHNVTYHTSDRAMTQRGFDRFKELFGHDSVTFANHSTNREGIYWGPARLSGWRRWLYFLLQRGQKFRGHLSDDPLFWGDLCRERVRYVRNFTFTDLNTLAMCPEMPYHDPARPWVNQWYAGSDAADINAFHRNINEATIDKLVAERGACLLYTHFGKYFHTNGKLDARFEQMMRYIASKNGWFVTAAELLDFLASQQHQPKVISNQERTGLENRWLFDQLAHVKHRFMD
jgi:hypothetical protein